jgi:transposase
LGDQQDRLSVWLRALIARRGYKRATVALAAKNARSLWALMAHGKSYPVERAVAAQK